MIHKLMKEFKKFCSSILNITPSKLTNNPWISHSIKELSRRKQRAYNCACLSRHPDDWVLYYQTKKEPA